MHGLLFAADPERAAAFASVVRDEGFALEVRLRDEAGAFDLTTPAECAIIFLDLALGPEVVRARCAELVAAHAPLAPLLAVIGEPEPPHDDSIAEAGGNLFISDELQALGRRCRQLRRGAMRTRFELAQTLRRLHESEERYRIVVGALEEGLTVRTRDGKMTTVNASVGRILGLTAEELRTGEWTRGAFQFLGPDGGSRSTDELPSRRAMHSGEAVHDGSLCVRRRDGSVVWLSATAHPLRDPGTGEVVAAVTTFVDRTEQRRVERELHALLERGPDAVLVHRDDRVVWANAKWAELLGYADPREVVGLSPLAFVPPRFHELAGQRLAARSAGREVPPLEHPLLRRDGSEVTVRLVGMPMLFQDQPALVTFARDLTEREQLEVQLVAADRLAALGRLAASVGHEINNPLTYVIGNLELALRRVRAVDPRVTELLEEALSGADRVRRIVRDLRVFSQRQSEERVPLDLRRLLASCIRMTEGEIRHRARLVERIEDLPRVAGNEARVAQVITNLLLNAAQAIPEGRRDATITVSARRGPDDRVEICVEDTGVGIAAEDLPHVFEPFFTTKTAKGGTGLGMSICRMLVAAEGGEIDIASELGRGTRVTVRLSAGGARAAPAASPAASPSSARKKILLVDDEVRIAELLRDSLQPHEVTIATTGRDALALVASAGPFDVIVCDLMMPEISGMDVHERLKLASPGLEQRIVFLTGGAFTPRATSFLANIPNPCLEKPFAIEALLAAIEQAAARAHPAGPG